MVHFLLSLSKPGAQPPLAPSRHHRSPTCQLAPVHAAEADDDRTVAQEHYSDEQCHEHGVGQREGQCSPLLILALSFCLHLDETPRAWAILLVPPVAKERQQAEYEGKEIDEEEDDLSEAAAYMFGVEIRVTDGEAPLHRHSTEDEHRGQAEERHGEGEESAQPPISSQTNQRFALGIANEHWWTE